MAVRGFAVFAALVGVASLHAGAAAPPAAFAVTEPAALDEAWREVPPPVRPAVEMQKLLLKVRRANRVEEWRGEMEKFATTSESDSVSAGLRELAKCWLARAAMVEVDGALRTYYRKEVRFPDSLAVVEKEIPAGAKADPWGEPWIYRPTAPKAVAKWTKQRYELGPTRAPQLLPLAEAVQAKAVPAPLKAASREAGGAKALQLTGADGKVAIVQAGSRFGEYGVLFIAEGWALLADRERLLTLSF